MSNLSRDAQELLTGSPPPDEANTETPAEQDVKARLEAIDTRPPAWQKEPPKPTMIPAEVVETVEGKAVAAEERATRLQAAWEGAGGTFDDQGNPIPPAQGPGFPPAPMQMPAAPMQMPQLDALAESLAEATGADPGGIKTALAGAIIEIVGPLAQQTLSPLFDNAVAANEQALAADPDFAQYRDAYRYHLSVLPPAARVSPDAAKLARALARDENFDKYVERAVARKMAGQGKKVGVFVENAAPGSFEEAQPAPFSDGTLSKLKQWGVNPREIAAAEARREVSGRKARE